jgi:hypothetical protein
MEVCYASYLSDVLYRVSCHIQQRGRRERLGEAMTGFEREEEEERSSVDSVFILEGRKGVERGGAVRFERETEGMSEHGERKEKEEEETCRTKKSDWDRRPGIRFFYFYNL